ncbi:MAG: glycerol-3-phosphate 1-O-acyltransferase PlsY [Cyanobacteria bacterium J06642_2]
MNSVGALAIALVVCSLAGYLWGSIPTGYLIGRWLGGLDIREHGSGSTGTTNVLRTLGKGPALGVLLVDLAKGSAAVATARAVANGFEADSPELVAVFVIVAALAAIVGHSKPVWLGWRGGKSAATSLGILLAIAWPVGLATLVTWLSVLALSRIVSLSSILAAIAAPVFMWVFGQSWPFVAFAIAGGAYVVLRHRSNIQRLLAGREPRIGQKLDADPQSVDDAPATSAS